MNFPQKYGVRVEQQLSVLSCHAAPALVEIVDCVLQSYLNKPAPEKISGAGFASKIVLRAMLLRCGLLAFQRREDAGRGRWAGRRK